ncbi:MAG: hypothetical protein H6741_33455 [Alphaproteobacteria bacterium]|nr:hypothetical protein [Alphaproteobacteria bacterium]
MDWLEQIAEERGHSSLSRLAAAMREQGSWPKGAEHGQAHLANQLRLLNRGERRSWWRGPKGGPLLPALAEALGEDLDEVERWVLDTGSPRATPDLRSYRFDAFPRLRPLELGEEPPLPGVPELLWRKGGPREPRTWWVAPSGSGKTLLGRWLEVRYGWVFVQASSWTEALDELPERGRVFVELGRSPGVPIGGAAALPEALRVCVACPDAPPRAGEEEEDGVRYVAAPREETPAEWQEVWSDELEHWLPALLEWVQARVRPGGGYDAEAAARLVHAPGFTDGLETPGEILALLSVLEELGASAMLGEGDREPNPLRWIRTWLRSRVDAAPESGARAFLHQRGPELLLALEAARLRAGAGGEAPLELWQSWVPEAWAPPVDRDRLRQVLAEGGPDAAERALRMLSPQPTELIDALRETGLLAPTPEGFALRPRWVATVLLAMAMDALSEQIPEGLGALLLHPDLATGAAEELLAVARAKDWEGFERCLAVAGDRIEEVACVDAAVRALGTAALLGVEVPVSLCAVAVAKGYALRAPGHPNNLPEPVTRRYGSRDALSLASAGAWSVAMLELSRVAHDGGEAIPDSLLTPWAREALDPQARERLGAAFWDHHFVDQLDGLLAGYERLGAALLDRFGALQARGPHEVQAADILVACVLGERAHAEGAERVALDWFCAPDSLQRACARRGTTPDAVLRWCWSRWVETPGEMPLRLGWRGHHEAWRPHLGEVWALAPADRLGEGILKRLEGRHELWPVLPEAVWRRWLDWREQTHQDFDVPESLAEYMPEGLMSELLRARRVGWTQRRFIELAWRRAPGGLMEICEALAQEAPDPGVDRRLRVGTLIYEAPPAQHEALIDLAEAWLAAPERYPAGAEVAPRWLLYVVREQRPGWRRAFEQMRRAQRGSQEDGGGP